MDKLNLVEYFQKELISSNGEIARNYLTSRGIDQDTALAYRVGWCPDSINNDVRWGRRIIFPLIDEHNQFVGFSGRLATYDYCDEVGNQYILEIGTNRMIQWTYADGSKKIEYHKAKYHDSFPKTSFLFGLNIAKQHIKQNNYVVIVEGQFDAAILYANGIKNVVALLGSALTMHHIIKLYRYCDLAIFLFDSDNAGFKTLEKAKATVIFDYDSIILPEGYDPHEFVMQHGIVPIQARIQEILYSREKTFEQKQNEELDFLLSM